MATPRGVQPLEGRPAHLHRGSLLGLQVSSFLIFGQGFALWVEAVGLHISGFLLACTCDTSLGLEEGADADLLALELAPGDLYIEEDVTVVPSSTYRDGGLKVRELFSPWQRVVVPAPS